MINTRANPLMKGDGPCTVKMIRRAAEVSASLMTFSNYRSLRAGFRDPALPHSEAIRAGAEDERKVKGLRVDRQHTRVLVCIIAALLLVIWFALWQQYY
jgi:hypothetical protein